MDDLLDPAWPWWVAAGLFVLVMFGLLPCLPDWIDRWRGSYHEHPRLEPVKEESNG